MKQEEQEEAMVFVEINDDHLSSIKKNLHKRAKHVLNGATKWGRQRWLMAYHNPPEHEDGTAESIPRAWLKKIEWRGKPVIYEHESAGEPVGIITDSRLNSDGLALSFRLNETPGCRAERIGISRLIDEGRVSDASITHTKHPDPVPGGSYEGHELTLTKKSGRGPSCCVLSSGYKGRGGVLVQSKTFPILSGRRCPIQLVSMSSETQQQRAPDTQGDAAVAGDDSTQAATATAAAASTADDVASSDPRVALMQKLKSEGASDASLLAMADMFKAQEGGDEQQRALAAAAAATAATATKVDAGATATAADEAQSSSPMTEEQKTIAKLRDQVAQITQGPRDELFGYLGRNLTYIKDDQLKGDVDAAVGRIAQRMKHDDDWSTIFRAINANEALERKERQQQEQEQARGGVDIGGVLGLATSSSSSSSSLDGVNGGGIKRKQPPSSQEQPAASAAVAASSWMDQMKALISQKKGDLTSRSSAKKQRTGTTGPSSTAAASAIPTTMRSGGLHTPTAAAPSFMSIFGNQQRTSQLVSMSSESQMHRGGGGGGGGSSSSDIHEILLGAFCKTIPTTPQLVGSRTDNSGAFVTFNAGLPGTHKRATVVTKDNYTKLMRPMLT